MVDTSPLLEMVHDGLGALSKAHRGLLADELKSDFADSLDLDAALEAKHPQENRWDYLVGHGPTKNVIAIESHTATDKQVSVVIEKRSAARRQLRDHLRDGAQPSAWIWVTEGKGGFAQSERTTRLLDQAGITFASRKVLSKHIPKP